MSSTYPIVTFSIMDDAIVFQDTDVIEAEVTQEIHPVGIELPASTARIRVWLDDEIVDEEGRTLRDKFRPFSDGIYYQSMTTGLIVDVSERIVDEDNSIDTEHFVGRFYLEEWNTTKEGELELVCTDAVGMLDNKTYLGNFYETPTRVDAIVADIFRSVDIFYSIDTDVAERYLKGYIPGEIPLREALQQVLFACGAYPVTRKDESDIVYLTIKSGLMPTPDHHVFGSYGVEKYGEMVYGMSSDNNYILDAYIPKEEKTDSQELNILQLVTGVEITSHDYSKSETLEEIFSAYLAPGDYMVVYDKPYWYVEASGAGDAITYLATADEYVLLTPDSGEIYPDVTILTTYGEFEFGVNYVYLHVPFADPLPLTTVSGKPWLDAKQNFEWVNPDWETSHTPPNVWKITNATLVPFNQSGAEITVEEVLARVAEYASLRYQQKATLFPRTDIELGEIDMVESLYNKNVVGIVERTTSDLTGGYLIETEFVGVESNAT